MSSLHLLFETASGYALFERVESEEVADQLPQVQDSISSMNKFGKLVKLKSFIPFPSAESALENINDVSEGVLNDLLKNFLEVNFPKVKAGKKSKYVLGVSEEKLGSAIQEGLGIQCQKSPVIAELLRGIRLHLATFIKELKEGDVERAQLGLAHSYSRAKVKFNIHRADNNIIQSINLLDQLDKDLNTFSMRNREWYSWHFPELVKVVNDNYKFAKLTKFIKSKDSLTQDSLEGLEEIVGDRDIAERIVEVASSSMGQDISDIDMINVERFADRVINLFEYRTQLHQYLVDKMNVVAPNLATLIGEQVGARLISHAGSLTSLAKYPASTVQILGAEKALFRALKTKGNTPKYGLIFHSTFIGRAATKNKGRISRYLANKCSIAARIDSFSETATTTYGEKLKEQVEERLAFYDSGEPPRKNVDVMHEAFEQVETARKTAADGEKKKKKKKSKRAEPEPEPEAEAEPAAEEPKKKKKKKSAE